LTHGVCIADVGLDDLGEGLLHSLPTEDENNEEKCDDRNRQVLVWLGNTQKPMIKK